MKLQEQRGDYMKYGLIGEHLSHSFSKQIHERLADYHYDLCPLSKEEFPIFMEQKDFQGINVTIPYKIDVLPYLDVIDDKAKRIGSVNTIVQRDGQLYGYNTDYDGFAYLLKQHNVKLQGEKVLIIGDGGAAKAIQRVVEDANAESMIKVRRSKSKEALSYEEVYAKHTDCTVIINTSPSGMYPHDEECPLDLTLFPRLTYVVDVIYHPLRTTLCINANQLGIPSIGGLEMLIAQAKVAVEHFQGNFLPDSCINDIYQDMMKEMTSIVLIGMPSCGKSTLGKNIALRLQKEFYDVDIEIEKKAQKSIKEIFADEGEQAFRDMETSVIQELSSKKNCVIATGGGSILRKENVTALKRNGVICYIQREQNELLVDDARPLSTSEDAIAIMYQQRKPLYEAAKDFTITNNRSLEEVTCDLETQYLAYIKQL